MTATATPASGSSGTPDPQPTDTQPGASAEHDRRNARRAVTSSFVGTAIEWYDFFIYGTAAALVIGPQFFPGGSSVASTLAAFATFAVGFVARPMGGVVMGHYGDRIGRKSMLVLSLVLMGAATVGIGLLPTFDAIGVAAPILLVLLRFVQGIGVGGEWGGAVLVATENAPTGKRGLYGAAPQLGVPAGVLGANLVFLLMTTLLDDAAFASWGWRIPFLVSAALVGVAMWIRLGVAESDEFSSARQTDAVAKLPVVEVLRRNGKVVLLAAGTFVATNGIAYAFMVYVLTYGTEELGFPRSTMLWLLIGACPVWMAGMALSAWKSDTVGRLRVYVIASTALVVAAAAFFPLLDTASIPLMTVAMLVLGFVLGTTAGPQSALFAELFPVHLRYSGASLGYQIGAILGGGLAPLLATSLYAAFGDSLAVTGYFVVLAVISLGSVLALRASRAEPPTPTRADQEVTA
ncbi:MULTISPECIES: MFS transporter [Prauserella salsuginis group]|uniref:MFS transporter n=2 Tax=Prauserella salsuginis group TaxID=2893672 RepID=A0ABW6G3X4_9PSEU|nr:MULTISPECIES: MFS transporter [Prauserella salsuginis group]MBB3664879.1 metabolite-proton symporter [Prauserella sediminis]MCR3718349.1 metabolite-proton symporter [Prauserella flava]MCR3732919.1 metabolite-proton symporter [Prauserella salsuginis]